MSVVLTAGKPGNGKYLSFRPENLTCESCPFVQIRHLKKVMDNSYRCGIFKFRECWDETMKSVYDGTPAWCPRKISPENNVPIKK